MRRSKPRAECGAFFMGKMKRFFIFVLPLSLGLVSCSQQGIIFPQNLPFVKIDKASSRIFLTDFPTAWSEAQNVISTEFAEITKSQTGGDSGQGSKYGFLETRWVDNTDLLHFLNVFSDEDFFLRSRYKLQIQVREGKKDNQPAVMVRVLKIHQMEKTFLSGWEDVPSDGVDESTILYRMGRKLSRIIRCEARDDFCRKLREAETSRDDSNELGF